MKFAPLDMLAVSLVKRSVPVSPIWRLRVHRDRLATFYRLVLDFGPLCDNLLAALDAARFASMSHSAAR
jgi:hypothetical protein